MRSIFRVLFFISSILGVLFFIIGGFSALYFYNRLDRDLPRIEKISDYRPKAVSSILASDGKLLAEVWDERRYPVSLAEIPPHVKNAFLAAEDASFYVHSGIDYMSIFRAIWVNLTSGANKQGASTITQQIVKELLLTREKTYERKLKEALLSYRLEKYLTKDEILSIYLNQIFLGSGAYGIKAAALVHFRKPLSEISIAQAAFLGALPKKPSELTKPENSKMAIDRQKYVLRQMYDKKFITEEEYKQALLEQLKIYPQHEENLFGAPYFSSYAIKQAEEIIQNINPEYSLRDPGGFTVKTTSDSNAENIADRELKKGLEEIDKRQGWRGPLTSIKKADSSSKVVWDEFSDEQKPKFDTIYKALVTEVFKTKNRIKVSMGDYSSEVDLSPLNWIKTKATLETGSPEIKREQINPISLISIGDIVEVSFKQDKDIIKCVINQTPAVQGAFVLIHVPTGEVRSLVGGYDYKLSKFNRATQANLQPGSSFKPFVYLTALQKLHYTPSTLVPDSPISFQTAEGIWAPQNFDEEFLGPITLRTALQKSRNVVSVFLINKVGVDSVIANAMKFGISTPIPRNMSIALGTPEVHVIEMARAYTAFASGGYLPTLQTISSIQDRAGHDVFVSKPSSTEVIDAPSAFILTHMLRGVIDRGTAQNVKVLGRPIAGKTGTTNDHMDAWFIGYTPDWVLATWVGFDSKRSLGKLETGGKAAAPIFIGFMREFLGESAVLDFIPPEGVVPVSVDVTSGMPVDEKSEGAFIEYFKADHNPTNQENNISKDIEPNNNQAKENTRTQEEGDYLTNSDF